MSATIHNTNRASPPTSKEELQGFLQHLEAMDTNKDHHISASEFMAHILAEAKNNPDYPLEKIREDVVALRDFPALQKRWQEKDPAVSAVMMARATDAQSLAGERLSDLLGQEPQFIAEVLQQNTGDHAALKLQQKDERAAAAQAAAQARSDDRERAQTQAAIDAAVPAGPARDAVKGITKRGPQTDEQRMQTAVGQIPEDTAELQDPDVRRLLGLPPLAGTSAPAPEARTPAEAGMDAAIAQSNARQAAAVDPDIITLREKIAKYHTDNASSPTLNDLDSAISAPAGSATKSSGPRRP